MNQPGIILTADGSNSLTDSVTGQTYHSINGALTESQHVFIRNGLLTQSPGKINIFEAGFGTGLNAMLSASEKDYTIDYYCIDNHYPGPEITEHLNYCQLTGFDKVTFRALHAALPEIPAEILPGFKIIKHLGRIEDFVPQEKFHGIYFDLFSPDVHPSGWTVVVFRNLYQALIPGGWLVTYSARGSVKEALRDAGFLVKRLPGAPGKRHMLRAVKSNE